MKTMPGTVFSTDRVGRMNRAARGNRDRTTPRLTPSTKPTATDATV